VATIQCQRASSALPPADTPCRTESFPARSRAGDPAHSARPAWRSPTPSPAGTPHVRTSKDSGRPDGLSQGAVARVVRPGMRRIRGQREALRGGLSCPDLAGVRADFRDHLTDWWRIHVYYASWGGQDRPPRGTTQPTRDLVCSEPGYDERGRRRGGIGISESTYKRCRRWWQARGYVAIVRPGWTPDLLPMALTSPEDHNERQVLVLCLPRQKPAAPPREPVPDLSGPLTGSRREPGKAPYARDPQTKTETKTKPEKDRAARGQSLLPRPGPAPLATVPQTGSEALTAARAMQERARLLQGLSAEHLRHLARPFWRAGWRPADVLHAIDHAPGGRQHGYTAAVRFPAAWIRARLAAWLGPDGTPLPSPSQQRAAAAARARAEAAARRAETARLAAGRTADTPGWAGRARALLTARGGTVARDLHLWQQHHAPEPGPAAGNRPRTAPRSPLRPDPGRARPSTPAPAPAAATAPRTPEPPAWWTRAVAAAAQETAEPDRQDQPDRNSMTRSGRAG
jgi:hypothetical protein